MTWRSIARATCLLPMATSTGFSRWGRTKSSASWPATPTAATPATASWPRIRSCTAQASIALDASGNLFIADYWDNRIRMVDTNDIITTVVGVGPSLPTPADSRAASAATAARPLPPSCGGLAAWRWTAPATCSWATQTMSASARWIPTTYYHCGGNWRCRFPRRWGRVNDATMYGPVSLAVDACGNLFFSDAANNRVRELVAPGRSLTLSGTTGGNAGGYDVVVMNAYGSVTSSVATLTVTLPPLQAAVGNANSINLRLSGTRGSSYNPSGLHQSLPAGQLATAGHQHGGRQWRLHLHRHEPPVISRPFLSCPPCPEAPSRQASRRSRRAVRDPLWTQQDGRLIVHRSPTYGIGYAGERYDVPVINAMRTFLRHVATGQYFQSLEKWTLRPRRCLRLWVHLQGCNGRAEDAYSRPGAGSFARRLRSSRRHPIREVPARVAAHEETPGRGQTGVRPWRAAVNI